MSIILFKKRLWHRCFPVNIAKFVRAHFIEEYLRETASENLTCTCTVFNLQGKLTMNVLRNISTFAFHAHGMLKTSSKKLRPDIFQKNPKLIANCG